MQEGRYGALHHLPREDKNTAALLVSLSLGLPQNLHLSKITLQRPNFPCAYTEMICLLLSEGRALFHLSISSLRELCMLECL